MHVPNLIAALSRLPAAIFSVAVVVHFSSRPAGSVLLAGLDLGDKLRKSLELLFVIATVFLMLPGFRAAGVALACVAMIVLATVMLIHSKFDYAIPALFALATLPLALPGPQ
jgi:hypothetical protein